MTDLYPNQELAVTNLTGDVNDLENEDFATGYVAGDQDADTNLRVGMADPGAGLDGEQTVRFGVRKSSDGGNDPDARFFLYEGGTQVTQLGGDITITADTGEEHIRTFDATDITNSADVELRVEGERSGGMPQDRRTVEPRYITWVASLDVYVEVTTDAATSITTSEATLNGTVDFSGDSADVWFEYGEIGAGLPSSTPTQTFTEAGEHAFDEALTGLDSDTEYEFRAHAERDSEETDTGDVLTVWTEPETPAAPTDLSGEFV